MTTMIALAVILLCLTACAFACAVIAAKKKGGTAPKVVSAVLLVILAAMSVYFASNLIYNLPADSKPDPIDGAVTDPETAPETVAETLPETVAETVPETVPETEVETVPKTVPETEVETVPETVSETEVETVTETVPETVAETVPVTVPETVAETVPETVPETEPETEAPETESVYAVLAREKVGEVVDKTVELLNAARIGGSGETYPFEPRCEYETLNEAQRAYYDIMVDSVAELRTFSFDCLASDENGAADIEAAYEAFRADHPGYTYYFRLSKTEAEGAVRFDSHYFLPSDNSVTVTDDKSALLYDIACFEAVCDYIVDSMPEDLCTYDKYRYLAAVVSLSTIYDHEGELLYTADTPYGPIMDGLAICVGYTVAFEYLCERADLYCDRVWGTTYNNLIHMWNLVKLDSGTYHVDVTWSDSDRNTPFQKNWQKYYMVTQNTVLTNHIISDGTVATGTVEKFK